MERSGHKIKSNWNGRHKKFGCFPFHYHNHIYDVHFGQNLALCFQIQSVLKITQVFKKIWFPFDNSGGKFCIKSDEKMPVDKLSELI
jgi:hypothetical protein